MNRPTRRHVLQCAAGILAAPRVAEAREAPAAPVAVAQCREYGPTVLPVLETMFDQLGGLGRLVKGKTVGIKLCLNNNPTVRQNHLPAETTHWPNTSVVGATLHLMERAGARRIWLLESPWHSMTEPVEEHIWQGGVDPAWLLGAAGNAEFRNTNNSGPSRKYARLPVPHGGHLFPSYDLNRSYEDCEVFVSMAKLKDHVTTGVTLGMKNIFGCTPSLVYDRHAVFHNGKDQPKEGAAPEKDTTTSRHDGYRIPRVLADLVAARPVDLTIIDGIRSLAGAQWPRPWTQAVAPGVILAGTNVVCTDAVAMTLMNYDPTADRGTEPFKRCDNALRLAEELGVGTRDPRRIEVRGAAVEEARFDYLALRRARQA